MSTSESTMRKKTLGHSFRRTFSLVLALTVSIGGFVVLWIESRMLDVRAIINIQEGGSWSSSVHNPYSLPVTTNGQNASYSHSHCYGALPKVPGKKKLGVYWSFVPAFIRNLALMSLLRDGYSSCGSNDGSRSKVFHHRHSKGGSYSIDPSCLATSGINGRSYCIQFLDTQLSN